MSGLITHQIRAARLLKHIHNQYPDKPRLICCFVYPLLPFCSVLFCRTNVTVERGSLSGPPICPAIVLDGERDGHFLDAFAFAARLGIREGNCHRRWDRLLSSWFLLPRLLCPESDLLSAQHFSILKISSRHGIGCWWTGQSGVGIGENERTALCFMIPPGFTATSFSQ